MDTALFYFINHRLSNPLFDMFMPFFTDRWYLFGLPCLAYFFYKDWRRALLSVVLVFVAIGIADFAGNQIKHLTGRIRPCRELTDVNLLKGCGQAYSMPSNHAANAFAAMSTLFFIWRGRIALALWFIAALVAFSRVYLGVHYPADILAGAVLGTVVGYSVALWFRFSRYFDAYRFKGMKA